MMPKNCCVCRLPAAASDRSTRNANRPSKSYRKVPTALLLALSLLFVSGRARAQNPNATAYDRGLRHFYWLYTFDPAGHQRRDWYQESASTWNEIYEDGRYNHSRVVDNNAIVDGNAGIICIGDTSTLRLFIPNPDAQGTNPKWLRIQQTGAGSWTMFAPMVEENRRQAPILTAEAPAHPTQAIASNMVIARTPAAGSQSKIDADASDVAAMQRRIDYAHSERIPELDSSKSVFMKGCKSGKPRSGEQDAAELCEMVANEMTGQAAEEVLLRGCSYPHRGSDKFNPCLSLADGFIKDSRYIEALAVLASPNAEGDSGCCLLLEKHRLAAYKALGNDSAVRAELTKLCYDKDQVHYCKQLQALGENVDLDDARQRQSDRNRKLDADAAQRQAEEEADRRQRAERREATVQAINDAASSTLASIQQTQAAAAEARVNAAAIRMAQQNKGAGGYPTTSSGGSSSSGTSSSTSTRPAAKQNASASSDSSDSDASSDSSGTSSGSSSGGGAAQPFNPYSSTANGYNAYSGQGVPSVGASNPGENGHWTETEVNVTCYSKFVPKSLITAVLVNDPGQANCNGAFVEFNNPDPTHPFFYGFAGVVNERMEANTTRDVRWGAPYLYKDRPNPAFTARVTIRYFVAR